MRLPVAVIVATKDRPQELSSLLQRLADLRDEFMHLVVVDSSGEEVRDRNAKLLGSLFGSEEYHFQECDVESLTVQKNRAFELLQDLKLRDLEAIQILDDDTSPDPGFISGMFENLKKSGAVGVSGITSDLPRRSKYGLVSKFALCFGLEGPQGKITKGGIGMAVDPDGREVEVEWLIGCSMWNPDVLHHRYSDRLRGSALFEDLEFSSRVPGLKIVNTKLVLNHQSSSVNRPEPFTFWFRFARNRYLLVESERVTPGWYCWSNIGLGLQILFGKEGMRALSLLGLVKGTFASLRGGDFL